MSDAVFAVVGIVVGALLGGTGKYFTGRRDAWKEARASGLLLLADVQALLKASSSSAQVVVETELGVKKWESHRPVLAAFRRGAYPNGFVAAEWLSLAGRFARLKELDRERREASDDDWWSLARTELQAAEQLLWPFSNDPRIVLYMVRARVPFLKRDMYPDPPAHDDVL